MKELIARRAARLLQPGWVVNLGIGIPTLVAKYVDEGVVFLHSENGVLGVGPPPGPGELDVNLIDAGKRPITVRPGAAYFDSAQSFAMIRGGHVNAAVLGALQVDGQGIIANWAIPGELVLGVGGAMDLLSGVRTVIVVMSHTTREGEPKIVSQLTLPKSSLRPADYLVTELATFRVRDGGLVLDELVEGVSIDELKARTAAPFSTA
ncbi:MAG: 3-oxoacid CoA-transferase subunit B [Deltaproteobacteria bacterium]|nr:MAG: 3-oxoacid CoA-transferase subunit B [Deltaproteobacteria bacterium]